MVPAVSGMLFHSGFYVLFELLPLVFMFHIIFGTVFSGNIMMADQVVRGQIQLITEPGSQPDQGIVGLLAEFAAVIRMADFDGQGVEITGSSGIGYLGNRDNLQNLPFQADDEMTAADCAGLLRILISQVIKVSAVGGRGGVGIGHIMDHNIVDLLQGYIRTGEQVLADKFLLNPGWRLDFFEIDGVGAFIAPQPVTSPKSCRRADCQRQQGGGSFGQERGLFSLPAF